MVDLQAPARLRAKPVRITELNTSHAGLIWYMRCICTLRCINLVVPVRWVSLVISRTGVSFNNQRTKADAYFACGSLKKSRGEDNESGPNSYLRRSGSTEIRGCATPRACSW